MSLSYSLFPVATTTRLMLLPKGSLGVGRGARDSVISCLTLEERASFSLAPAPPPWCITGADRETENDPSRWVPKPPYDSDAWRNWLNAVHVARDKGDSLPPVPHSPN